MKRTNVVLSSNINLTSLYIPVGERAGRGALPTIQGRLWDVWLFTSTLPGPRREIATCTGTMCLVCKVSEVGSRDDLICAWKGVCWHESARHIRNIKYKRSLWLQWRREIVQYDLISKCHTSILSVRTGDTYNTYIWKFFLATLQLNSATNVKCLHLLALGGLNKQSR